MTVIICNGCESQLGERDVVLEGRRANGLTGGGLPDGEFHLCLTCSTVAFHAIATQPPKVDTHRLAGEIVDARIKRPGA